MQDLISAKTELHAHETPSLNLSWNFSEQQFNIPLMWNSRMVHRSSSNPTSLFCGAARSDLFCQQYTSWITRDCNEFAGDQSWGLSGFQGGYNSAERSLFIEWLIRSFACRKSQVAVWTQGIVVYILPSSSAFFHQLLAQTSAKLFNYIPYGSFLFWGFAK